ncbi:hypothetical protein ACFQ0M_02030 [Kitasatospora aburaviensis]
MSRPVPWIPGVLYGAVLLGGVYYAVIGPGPGPGPPDSWVCSVP